MAKKERKTAPPLVPLFSDGLHFVRPATEKDQHPMRFLVYQHRVEGMPRNPSLPRHVESLDKGKELCAAYTEKAFKADKELHRNWMISQGLLEPPKPVKVKAVKVSKPPKVKVPKVKVPKVKPIKVPKPPKVKPVAFPKTRFVCIIVNPVAQIWVCTKDPWETLHIGRRINDGATPKQNTLPHIRGDYAVLCGDIPVLDEKGVPKVFTDRIEAERVIKRLYDETPEDERYTNNMDPKRPTTRVYANLTMSVHFDPTNNGALWPFNIYNMIIHRPYLHGKWDSPRLFKSITGAITEADIQDKLYRGIDDGK